MSPAVRGQVCRPELQARRLNQTDPLPEFRFNGDSEKIRTRFLEVVSEFEFKYSSLVLNKQVRAKFSVENRGLTPAAAD